MTYCRFENVPAWQEAIRFEVVGRELLPPAARLGGLAAELRNEGQRHLDDASRRRFESKPTADDFRRELMERLPPDHPLRRRP